MEEKISTRNYLRQCRHLPNFPISVSCFLLALSLSLTGKLKIEAHAPREDLRFFLSLLFTHRFLNRKTVQNKRQIKLASTTKAGM